MKSIRLVDRIVGIFIFGGIILKSILQAFPEQIETERLYIRPCLPGDGPVIYESINQSREHLKKWLPFATKEESLEEMEANIRLSYANFIKREDFRLHIYRKEDDVFIGSTGLHRVDWNVRKFEIGYWCDVRHQNQGYITESTNALTQFAFKHFEANRIEIRCDPNNMNSRRIAEKCGYTQEGVLRNSSLSADGQELRDTCVYAKTGLNL